MANNNDPNQKQPGEKAPGTFHYNPGNMSGKGVYGKEEFEQRSDADRKRSAPEQQDRAPEQPDKAPEQQDKKEVAR